MIGSEEREALIAAARALNPRIVAWRRTLHAMPELKMDTPNTERMIVSALNEIGIGNIRMGVGGHGVIAYIEGRLPGKCLAIRADCDGLPIREETGLPFASENGCMHACGHDAHTAIALGAAKLIHERRERLHGSVKLIFQPYEEGDGGAKRMIADGVLDSPRVDAVIALHNAPDVEGQYRAGDILLANGPSSANIYAYRAEFHGTGAHVAKSATAVNPVYMACDAVMRIEELAKADAATINAVPLIHAGVRNNIIPETCVVEGSIRSFDRKKHRETVKAVHTILEAAARERGGSVCVETTIDLMATENDSALRERFRAVASELFPGGVLNEKGEREGIGEDFARYADSVPGLYFFLCTHPDGTAYPLHSPRFALNEDVLHIGSAAFAAFALSWQEE